MTSDQPSYARQAWIFWRWRLILLAAFCGFCFAMVLGIHQLTRVEATTQIGGGAHADERR